MVIGVVVALPDVVFCVYVVLVDVLAQIDMSVDVAELGVVVERYRCKGVKEVRVNRASFCHSYHLLLLCSLLLGQLVWFIYSNIKP